MTKWIDYVTKKVKNGKKHRSESKDETATEVVETWVGNGWLITRVAWAVSEASGTAEQGERWEGWQLKIIFSYWKSKKRILVRNNSHFQKMKLLTIYWNVYWSNSNSPFSLQVVVVFSAELTDFDEVPDNSNKRPTYTVSSDSMQEKTRLQF